MKPYWEDDATQLYCGDCSKVCAAMEPASIGMIHTDPPYLADTLSSYSDLGTIARAVGRPGAVVAAYAGAMFLPEIMARMARTGLDWIWLTEVVHQHGSPFVRKWNLRATSKPVLLWHVPGARPRPHKTLTTLLRGDEKPRKDAHPWAQGIHVARALISRFCVATDTVLDPYCGSGTTLIAARQLGIPSIGIEIDPDSCEHARDRLENTSWRSE